MKLAISKTGNRIYVYNAEGLRVDTLIAQGMSKDFLQQLTIEPQDIEVKKESA